MMKTEKEYRRLNDYQHMRARTETTFGSRESVTRMVIEYDETLQPQAKETTWTPACFTAYREIVDNALDEIVKHGHGDHLIVDYDETTGVFKIADNGRGVPIAWDEEENNYAATILLSELKVGRNFNDDRGETRGLNGLGASAANMCSEYFKVDIIRDKKHFSQRFHEGNDDLIVEDPVIKASKQKTGTTIELKLSKIVFQTIDLPLAFIRSRLVEVAVCYPKLKVTFNGKLIATKDSVEKTLFHGRRHIALDIAEDGFKSKFWLIPQFFGDGVDLSYGLVNSIPSFDGGVHMDAFKSRFFAGLIDALAPVSRKRKMTPNRSDMNDGLLLFNITQMTAPSFDGQTKSRLITGTAKKSVLKAMDEPEFFKRVIKSHPEWIESIYERCALRTQKSSGVTASDKKKLKKRVENLSDACALDRSKCILFLAEGDSAVSGIVEARNPDIHGALPLRGKLLNVSGETIRKVLADEALCKIMNAIGLVPGERANRSMLRYNQVYLTCDADPDGANIFALLVNFFYTFWPELFDPNQSAFISVFDTPLIVAKKGKTRKYWHAENYADFDPDAHKGYEIVRAKGLGALMRDDWETILQKPKTVPITDDGKLKETLDLLFDKKRADDRKNWMGM